MTKRMMLVSVMLLCGCATVFGTLVPLQNAGFEQPVLAEGALNTTTLTGWSLDIAGRAFRVWNVEASYPVQPTEGSNLMWLAPAGSSCQISQITAAAIEAGKQYTLQFDAAMVSSFGGTPSYVAIIYATNGGVSSRTTSRQLVTTGSVVIPKDNTWQTVTLTWDSTGTFFAGEKFDFLIGGKVMIDNVRLTVVPEPASLCLMGLGLLLARFKRG